MWLLSSYIFILKFVTRNEITYGVSSSFSLQLVELYQLQSDETAYNLLFFICYWLIAVTYRPLTCSNNISFGAMSVDLLSSMMLVLHKEHTKRLDSSVSGRSETGQYRNCGK
jgi:hypothetical protein